MLIDKSKVRKYVEQFYTIVKTQFLKSIKCVQTNNGIEFLPIKPFFFQNDIIHQTTIPYTPQQNGRIERQHGHILNVAHALHLQAFLPVSVLSECVKTIVYHINQTPNQVLQGKKKPQFDILFRKPPKLFSPSCFLFPLLCS